MEAIHDIGSMLIWVR